MTFQLVLPDVVDPDPKTLDDVIALLALCHKYQMDGVATRFVRATLGGKMTATDPLRAYALACRVGAIDEASYAALQCLHIPLKDLIHSTTFEIRYLTALQFRPLLRYYDLRQTAANI